MIYSSRCYYFSFSITQSILCILTQLGWGVVANYLTKEAEHDTVGTAPSEGGEAEKAHPANCAPGTINLLWSLPRKSGISRCLGDTLGEIPVYH